MLTIQIDLLTPTSGIVREDSRSSPWRVFLASAGLPARGTDRPFGGFSRRANCSHGLDMEPSLSNGPAYHPEIGLHRQGCHPREGETGAVFPSPARRRIISPEAYRYALLRPSGPETPWDFHRSVPSAILSRRERQTPRRSTGSNRISAGGKDLTPSTLRGVGGRGAPPGPKRAPSRTVPAWPLRCRRLPSDTGYIPLSGSSRYFCTGTDPHR